MLCFQISASNLVIYVDCYNLRIPCVRNDDFLNINYDWRIKFSVSMFLNSASFILITIIPPASSNRTVFTFKIYDSRRFVPEFSFRTCIVVDFFATNYRHFFRRKIYFTDTRSFLIYWEICIGIEFNLNCIHSVRTKCFYLNGTKFIEYIYIQTYKQFFGRIIVARVHILGKEPASRLPAVIEQWID